jgi:hypothetical protein
MSEPAWRHDDDHECGGDDPDRMHDEMHEL